MTTKSPARLAAVSLAALFALTGCSSSEAFDFTETSAEPAESIEFQVPDELIELDEDYAENRVFESVTLTAVESDEPSECAVEYQFGYADDGGERLVEYIENTPRDEQTGDERMASVLTDESLDSIELEEDFSSAVVPVSCATSPTDDEDTARVSLSWVDEGGGEDGGVRSLVRAYVAVMQGGELYVQETEIMRDWELDSNGNWIQ